jgi:hypothetical protein
MILYFGPLLKCGVEFMVEFLCMPTERSGDIVGRQRCPKKVAESFWCGHHKDRTRQCLASPGLMSSRVLYQLLPEPNMAENYLQQICIRGGHIHRANMTTYQLFIINLCFQYHEVLNTVKTFISPSTKYTK